MDRHLLLVFSNAVEGKDDEFNDWYTNVHLSDMLAADGFVTAQRFQLTEVVAEREPQKLPIAVDGREEEFMQWFNNRHLPNAPAPDDSVVQWVEAHPGRDFAHRYLAVYEIETDDLGGAATAMLDGTPDRVISPALSPDVTTAYFTPITDRITAEAARAQIAEEPI